MSAAHQQDERLRENAPAGSRDAQRGPRRWRYLRGAYVLTAFLWAMFVTASGANASRPVCGNEALRLQNNSTQLPDCRAYEMVTPAEKGAAVTEDIKHSALVAEDGERVALYSIPRLEPNPQINGSFEIFAREAGSGWSPIPVTPAEAGQAIARQPIFSGDLTSVAFGMATQTPRGFEPPLQELLTGLAGGPYARIATLPIESTSEKQKEKSFDINLYGAAANLSDVVFATTDHELLGSPTGTDPGAFDLYEYHAGHIAQVNVTNSGAPVGACGAVLGYGEATENESANEAVSAEGSKIFFTSPDTHPVASSESGCSEPTQLYMRVNGRETMDISAPEAGVTPATRYPVIYAGASRDGKYVLFTTKTVLTRNDEGHTDNELYLYNTEARKLSRVSRGESGDAEGEVLAGLGGPEYGAVISEDGSTVYFIANGQLTANAPSSGPKLYRYDVATGDTTYVTVAASNAGSRHPLYATPNGMFLAFTSSYVGSEAQEEEVYRYAAARNEVSCLSCTGGPMHGVKSGFTHVEGGTELIGTPDITPWPHYISNDGRYVFFDSQAHLVAQDTSTAKSGPGEVYEWEAQGAGNCTKAQGCVHLISSGTEDVHGSLLLGASADGSDVFFLTHAQLVREDKDEVADIYGARIGGGFPVASAPSECGEACQGRPAGLPVFGAPASVAFSGLGNLTARAGKPHHKAHPGKRRGRKRQRRRLRRALHRCGRMASRHKRRLCRRRARRRFASASAWRGNERSRDRRRGGRGGHAAGVRAQHTGRASVRNKGRGR